MADAVTATVLHDGLDAAIVHLTNISDGTGETAVTKVDVSELVEMSSGLSCASVSIERISYACSGMSVRLLWDAFSDVLAVVLPQNKSGSIDYSSIGGLPNLGGSSASGDIKLTTVGASSGDQYSIILYLKKNPAASFSVFDPADLFAGGAAGAFYDFGDLSTLYQDAAGTTPVTAVEQPVGLVLDKSGNDNYASQATSASRPVYSRRYNLLTYSEQFDNAAWATVGQANGTSPVVTASAGLSPIGDMTAERVQFARTGTTITDRSRLEQVSIPVAASANYTFSIWLKSFDGADQTVSLFPNFGNGLAVAATVTSEWQRFSVSANTLTGTAATVVVGLGYVSNSVVSADVLVWGAQLQTAADEATTGGAYQRVAAATDYDTSNPVWRPYLRFDGVDDSLATSAIDFSDTDEMTAFAGVHKASDAAASTFAELTISSSVTPGGIGFFTNVNGFRVRSGGSVLLDASTGSTPAPATTVNTVLGDIGNDILTLRTNGVVGATNTADQGTGTYANAALYIGRRAGSSLALNGRIYSLVVLGRTATEAELTAAEEWLAGKTGVTLA